MFKLSTPTYSSLCIALLTLNACNSNTATRKNSTTVTTTINSKARVKLTTGNQYLLIGSGNLNKGSLNYCTDLDSQAASCMTHPNPEGNKLFNEGYKSLVTVTAANSKQQVSYAGTSDGNLVKIVDNIQDKRYDVTSIAKLPSTDAISVVYHANDIVGKQLLVIGSDKGKLYTYAPQTMDAKLIPITLTTQTDLDSILAITSVPGLTSTEIYYFIATKLGRLYRCAEMNSSEPYCENISVLNSTKPLSAMAYDSINKTLYIANGKLSSDSLAYDNYIWQCSNVSAASMKPGSCQHLPGNGTYANGDAPASLLVTTINKQSNLYVGSYAGHVYHYDSLTSSAKFPTREEYTQVTHLSLGPIAALLFNQTTQELYFASTIMNNSTDGGWVMSINPQTGSDINTVFHDEDTPPAYSILAMALQVPSARSALDDVQGSTTPIEVCTEVATNGKISKSNSSCNEALQPFSLVNSGKQALYNVVACIPPLMYQYFHFNIKGDAVDSICHTFNMLAHTGVEFYFTATKPYPGHFDDGQKLMMNLFIDGIITSTPNKQIPIQFTAENKNDDTGEIKKTVQIVDLLTNKITLTLLTPNLSTTAIIKKIALTSKQHSNVFSIIHQGGPEITKFIEDPYKAPECTKDMQLSVGQSCDILLQSKDISEEPAITENQVTAELTLTTEIKATHTALALGAPPIKIISFNEKVTKKQLFAGDFTKASYGTDSVPIDYRYMFSLNEYNGKTEAFLENSVTHPIKALAKMRGQIYAAGKSSFNRWNGLNWTELATVKGSILTLLADPKTNTIYVGGMFISAGNVNAINIVQWTQMLNSSWEWHKVGKGLYSNPVIGMVTSLTLKNETLYAGGSFTRSGNTVLNNIAMFAGGNWVPIDNELNHGGFMILSALTTGATEDDYAIYAGVDSISASLPSKAYGVFTRGEDATWKNVGANNWAPRSVNTVLPPPHNQSPRDSRPLFAGGEGFTDGTNFLANISIVKYDGKSWAQVGSGLNGTVYVLAKENNSSLDGGRLYVGGDFTKSGQHDLRHVAAWNGFAWLPISFQIDDKSENTKDFGVNDAVRAILPYSQLETGEVVAPN